MGNKIRAAAMVGPAATAADLARGKAGTTPCRRVVDRSKADRAADPAQSRLAPAGVLSKADRVVDLNRVARVVDPNRADRVVDLNRVARVADPNRADRVVDPNRADRVADPNRVAQAVDPALSRLAPAGVLSKADRVVNPNRADRVVNPNRADRVAVTGVMGLVAGTSLAVAMGRAVVLRDLGALDHKVQGASQGQAAFRLLVVPATILTPAVTEVEG
jgi:hypothetical protein